MRKELDDKLVEDYPILFADRHGDPRETAMCWGFPGDGWYHVIDALASQLETMIREWWDGLDEERREKVGGRPPCAIQVKEKFGGLRFYMTYYPEGLREEMEELIAEAERASFQTCEACGEPGVPRSGGWIKTLCDEHADGKEPQNTADALLDYAVQQGSEVLKPAHLNKIRYEFREVRRNYHRETNRRWVLRRAIKDVVGDGMGSLVGTDDEELAEMLRERFGEED